MELSSTAYVILGMLGWRPMTGYEIKALVDRSTRFFWAASYGQIYPELRRLAQAALIDGKASPQGGRKRTVYRLTSTGRTELRAWLKADPEVFESRDEGLLKLFFADAAGGEPAASALDAKRRHHARIVERLRAIEETDPPEGHSALVLRYGIECNEWSAKWCERAKLALEQGKATAERKS
jgi:DNA-binding PadR family transcriptional regulator